VFDGARVEQRALAMHGEKGLAVLKTRFQKDTKREKNLGKRPSFPVVLDRFEEHGALKWKRWKGSAHGHEIKRRNAASGNRHIQ